MGVLIRQMYKQGNYYYTSIQVNGERLKRSLRTKDKKEAKVREKKALNNLYNEILKGIDKRKTNPGNTLLVKAFLRSRKNCKPTTQATYKNIIENVWLAKKVFPMNKATIESYSKHINAFYNWSNLTYKTDFKKLDYEEGHGRIRVYNDQELELIFNSDFPCKLDKELIRFAYYTGAREGELLNIRSVNEGFMVVYGKRGTRVVKLTKQAQALINNSNYNEWNYTPDYVQKEFKKYVRSLGIKDAKFKDLRRTFGLNYILKGGMIYQLSKLLGHKRVITTEKHYAPLMSIFIPDFTL